ncbi:hypothetical protein C8J56DRAFT_1139647 [Mycena floridula]|nr:hypothetical protein C8J56DRAFT_1139647 [Mycena floridula]
MSLSDFPSAIASSSLESSGSSTVISSFSSSSGNSLVPIPLSSASNAPSISHNAPSTTSAIFKSTPIIRHPNTVAIATIFQTTVIMSNGVALTTVFTTTSATARDIFPFPTKENTKAEIKGIVGGVIGGLLGLLMIMVAVLLLLRWRRQKRMSAQFDGNFDPGPRASTFSSIARGSVRSSSFLSVGKTSISDQSAEGGTLPTISPDDLLDDYVIISPFSADTLNERSRPVMTGMTPVMTGPLGSSYHEYPLQPDLSRRPPSLQRSVSAYSDPASPGLTSAISHTTPSELSLSSKVSDSGTPRFSVMSRDNAVPDSRASRRSRSITKDQRESYLRHGPSLRDSHSSGEREADTDNP